MMSRLLLNLHQAASGTNSLDTTAVPLSTYLDTGTLVFSTQVFLNPETTVTTMTMNSKGIEPVHPRTDDTLMESESITEIRETLSHTIDDREVV